MAALFTAYSSSLSSSSTTTFRTLKISASPPNFSLSRSLSVASLSFSNSRPLRLPSIRIHSSVSGDASDPEPEKPSAGSAGITDEWGEKAELETEPESKIVDSDPPRNEDEWGGGVEEEYVAAGNGSPSAQAEDVGEEPAVEVDTKVADLKRCLVDTIYGTDFGFRASAEVRAEVTELVNQLEALNPTPASVENPGLLEGNWVLLYTASSELLPLLAVGATPLFKVEKITQSINTSSSTIVNSTTLSGPLATLSFSASADYEARSPSRIQVTFKEGSVQPPEIKSSINFPENIDIFGQKISLSPVQQTLSLLQEAVSSISRTISGQPPLKVPIPGQRTSSWLLISYLDEDLRISRGDGGLFVLAKEGSALLY